MKPKLMCASLVVFCIATFLPKSAPAQPKDATDRFLRQVAAPNRTVGADDRPNIVYIICDDLGYGDVHCLNPEHGKISTPNLDKLAKESMTFTDAHSGSSVCTPTRYGVLTGRYAWRTSALS